MEDSPNEEQLLLMQVAATATRRAILERDLAECRQRSRELALRLLFDYQYPLMRVSRLTGHQRPVLRTWIERAQADGQSLPAEAQTDA